ncbi:helix-turn-helix domain-containing protein [Novosphingobium rosa]|uniref:helix-turn-helix domain-containing protein n=1 Tax=Novosphingobium rosa TaxID=76978 RepID=UPI0008378165|nr:helix-turn-helix transcriptional regulator [Novosphingobium rosa]
MNDTATNDTGMNGRISLDSLTAKQCECLELVLHHLTSKQIALELGISPHTVNQRLDSARQRLGAATRHEAAILYAKLKGVPQSLAYHTLGEGAPDRQTADDLHHVSDMAPQPIPERLVYEPFILAQPQNNPLTDPAPTEEPMLTFSDAAAMAPREAQKAPMSAWMGTETAQPEMIRRLIHIFALAAAIMVMILVAVAAGEGLTRIFHGR